MKKLSHDYINNVFINYLKEEIFPDYDRVDAFKKIVEKPEDWNESTDMPALVDDDDWTQGSDAPLDTREGRIFFWKQVRAFVEMQRKVYNYNVKDIKKAFLPDKLGIYSTSANENIIDFSYSFVKAHNEVVEKQMIEQMILHKRRTGQISDEQARRDMQAHRRGQLMLLKTKERTEEGEDVYDYLSYNEFNDAFGNENSRGNLANRFDTNSGAGSFVSFSSSNNDPNSYLQLQMKFWEKMRAPVVQQLTKIGLSIDIKELSIDNRGNLQGLVIDAKTKKQVFIRFDLTQNPRNPDDRMIEIRIPDVPGSGMKIPIAKFRSQMQEGLSPRAIYNKFLEKEPRGSTPMAGRAPAPAPPTRVPAGRGGGETTTPSGPRRVAKKYGFELHSRADIALARKPKGGATGDTRKRIQDQTSRSSGRPAAPAQPRVGATAAGRQEEDGKPRGTEKGNAENRDTEARRKKGGRKVANKDKSEGKKNKGGKKGGMSPLAKVLGGTAGATAGLIGGGSAISWLGIIT